MTEEQAKALLAAGTISQEAYDKIMEAESSSSASADKDSTEQKEDKAKIPSQEDLERLIQSAVDRATNKLGNEKKQLKEELDTFKREKMTEDERRKYELAEKERAIQERESELKRQECKLYAIKALKKAGLDDGSDTSLELIEFVVAEDEQAIDNRVKSFSNLIKKLVSAEVDKTFKENGGKPKKGGASGGSDNPYKKESFNLTKQMELETNNPDMAKQLQALAGYVN